MRRDAQLPNGGATFGGLAHDAAAGANLALTMLPKAMAYAVVAGVPRLRSLCQLRRSRCGSRLRQQPPAS